MSTDSPPPAFQQLLDEKRHEQREARNFHVFSATAKTAGGAALGFIGGLTTVGAAIFKTSAEMVIPWSRRFKAIESTLEKMNPEEQNKLAEKMGKQLAEDVIHRIKTAPGVTGAIMRNPGTVITGATILAGGSMLIAHSRGRKHARDKVDREVAALESVTGQWQDRLKEEEQNPALGTPALS